MIDNSRFVKNGGRDLRTIVTINKRIEIITEDLEELKSSYLRIKTLYSVISPGTELSIIHNTHDRQIPLGYSAVGIIEECGEDTDKFQVGDIVACYGAPYVKHSESLLVPKTLCSKVPKNVEVKEAALAGIGAIAIHALRVAQLSFGEKVVVVGLGIIGQLIAQIADAAAYDVYAYDLSAVRTQLLGWNKNMKLFSERTQLEKAISASADAVLLCAGGSDSPLGDQSLEWIRDKGKVVIVGGVEPNFPRDRMFGKEASILISRAGGPGRYEPTYERDAVDYPLGFVRWTEGRNIGEFLRLLSEKRINVAPYLTEEVKFDQD